MDRISLSEARGLKDESDLRRYAVRDGSETYFYEGPIEDDSGPSKQGELAAALRTHIRNHGEPTEATEPRTSQTEADEAVEDRLEALGYKK
jgi:hypothetical protein